MTYPNSLDTFPSTLPNGNRIGHSALHNQISVAIRAMEEMMGITNSTDAGSFVYMLKNPLSISPGHKHSYLEVIGLGTSATLDVGTGANIVVALDSFAKLPAVDASQLINLPTDYTRGDVNGPGAGLTTNNEIVLWGTDSQHIKGSGVLWSTLLTSISNKVDKVAGKGLSTEDYTTSEKSKLAGIEAGAEVNPTSTDNLSEGSVNKYDQIVSLLAGAGIQVT